MSRPSNLGQSVFGGHVSEFPGPYVRWFDDKRRKPRVRVSVTMYYGIGKHYHVRVETDDNPFWDGSAWRTCWDDLVGRGRTFDRKYDDILQAERVTVRFLRRFFPRSKYKYEMRRMLSEWGAANRNWFGKYKQGD